MMFPIAKKVILETAYRNSGNSYDTINLLSCNYTDILDKLYFNSTNEFKSSFRNTGYGYSIEEPIHLHGTLSFGMTLGLSDDTQMAKFFSEDEKRYLLKEKLLVEMRESLDVRNSQIISNSDIIIIYGMSLGDTDKYLWNMAANHSIKHKVPVVVYHYIPNFDMSNPIKVQRFYNSLDNKFLEQSGLDEAGKKELNKNLITVIESQFLIWRENEKKILQNSDSKILMMSGMMKKYQKELLYQLVEMLKNKNWNQLEYIRL